MPCAASRREAAETTPSAVMQAVSSFISPPALSPTPERSRISGDDPVYEGSPGPHSRSGFPACPSPECPCSSPRHAPVMRVILLLCTVLLTGCASLLPLRGTPEPLPAASEGRIGELENGLRYYIRENNEPRARAELRLVVNAGSVLEAGDQRGAAHLVEHMAFNGTR